jgi:streptogramin lyase
VVVLVIVALGAWWLLRSRGSAEAGLPGYRLVADVPLTGDTSRLDYLSLDPQAHRLYVAHLGASTVTIFDTQANKVVQDVPGVAGVHGVIAVPELHRVYASATNDNKVAVIDDQGRHRRGLPSPTVALLELLRGGRLAGTRPRRAGCPGTRPGHAGDGHFSPAP